MPKKPVLLSKATPISEDPRIWEVVSRMQELNNGFSHTIERTEAHNQTLWGSAGPPCSADATSMDSASWFAQLVNQLVQLEDELSRLKFNVSNIDDRIGNA